MVQVSAVVAAGAAVTTFHESRSRCSYGAQTTAGSDPSSADGILNAAIAAFKQGDYNTAFDIINKGIAQFPSDSMMHEFRALVLFAKGDYQQAAATIHSVLAIDPQALFWVAI